MPCRGCAPGPALGLGSQVSLHHPCATCLSKARPRAVPIDLARIPNCGRSSVKRSSVHPECGDACASDAPTDSQTGSGRRLTPTAHRDRLPPTASATRRRARRTGNREPAERDRIRNWPPRRQRPTGRRASPAPQNQSDRSRSKIEYRGSPSVLGLTRGPSRPRAGCSRASPPRPSAAGARCTRAPPPRSRRARRRSRRLCRARPPR